MLVLVGTCGSTLVDLASFSDNVPSNCKCVSEVDIRTLYYAYTFLLVQHFIHANVIILRE